MSSLLSALLLAAQAVRSIAKLGCVRTMGEGREGPVVVQGFGGRGGPVAPTAPKRGRPRPTALVLMRFDLSTLHFGVQAGERLAASDHGWAGARDTGTVDFMPSVVLSFSPFGHLGRACAWDAGIASSSLFVMTTTCIVLQSCGGNTYHTLIPDCHTGHAHRWGCSCSVSARVLFPRRPSAQTNNVIILVMPSGGAAHVLLPRRPRARGQEPGRWLRSLRERGFRRHGRH